MPFFSSLPTGLVAITGGERTGKTTLLRRLTGNVSSQQVQTPPTDALWIDLALPDHDDQTPQQVWAKLRASNPRWSEDLHSDLVKELNLHPHLDKQLFMLSCGSRRKVALAGLLACGTTVTCLDQPYAALDLSSIRVVREFLIDMSDHSSRTWFVADYEADPHLPWKRVVSLDSSD